MATLFLIKDFLELLDFSWNSYCNTEMSRWSEKNLESLSTFPTYFPVGLILPILVDALTPTEKGSNLQILS